MKHKGTVTIETERIILRKFFAEDVQAAFRNWTNDEKVTEFLRWQVHRNLAVTERVVNDWMNHYKNSDYYQWAIVPKSVNEPIGTISVTDLMKKREKFTSDIVSEVNGGIPVLQARHFPQLFLSSLRRWKRRELNPCTTPKIQTPGK